VPPRVSVDDVLGRVARGIDPPLIAIDGLPCSGKSTLADTLETAHGLGYLGLDEFVLPEREWPSRRPAFPFVHVRYQEFMDAVRTLAATGRCDYAPFDWDTYEVSPQRKTVCHDKPVVVEGVSTLHPELTPLYGLRIFVDSDRASTFAAAMARDNGVWRDAWRELFLPSVDIYMQSRPERRADVIVPGRGAR
jgi:uridine kinase